jgi:hypothetical protein
VHALRSHVETQGRGLLRILLVRHREVSTEAGGQRRLRVWRVTRQRPQRPTAEEPFRLPANISMHKEILPDGTAYVFRHREMGVLGRIRIQARATGGSHLVCETAGDPGDPTTARRAALFEPLGRSIAALLPTDTAALARGDPPPPAPFDPGQWVRSERICCLECGEAVAFVTYAADATDRGRLEDYARRMYPQHARWNVPAWIVGPVRGQSSQDRGVADVLSAWPTQGTVMAMTGDQFDGMVDRLVEGHCRSYA